MASAKPDARSSPVESGNISSAVTARRAGTWTRFVRPQVPALIAVYAPLVFVLALARWIFLAHANDLIEPLTFDLDAILSHSLFTVLHVAGWTIALIVTLLGTRREVRDGHTPRASLLAGAALLSTLFLLDDLFQLHKPVIPNWAGVPSAAVLTLYACALAIWLLSCRREIARSDVAILVVTLVFFAAWFACKASPLFAARTSMEISLKLCGVAGWTLYAVRASGGANATSRESTSFPCQDRDSV
jgi:hypothetical protein